MASRLPVLLLVVCGTIRDCDGDAGIAAGGKAHLPLLRRFLPDHHGVAGARQLSIRINRIDPEPFFRSFPILGAGGLAGPSRIRRDRWQDFAMETLRAVGTPAPRGLLRSPSPFVLVFAPTTCRGLGQAAVEAKTNQRTSIPAHRGRRAEKDGLK